MDLVTARRIAFLLVVLGLTVLASQTAAAKKEAQTASMMPTGNATQYVGADTCKSCHEDVVNHFQANPHWTSTLKVGGTEVHACETCHGPGQAHVEGGGDKSKIFVFKGQRADVISGRCLTCHQATQEHGNFRRSQHFKNGVSCIDCHSPHRALEKNALLLEDQPTLCYRCHAETRADFAKPFRHRVNEKLIQCSDCHSPHGTNLPRRSLRTTAAQEQVCYNCHRDKQGPFLYEHLPVKTEGCISCHTPHGSTNPRLLRVYPVNILCMQCHTQVMISATQATNGVPAVPTFHNQAQKYQACTMCHPAIHGSNGAETFEY
jgi:DmsE family decaheme c-type cytochrome